jgi:type II secretory pathway component PulF
MSPVKRAALFSTLAKYHEAGLSLDAALVEWAQQQPSVKIPATRAAALLRGGMPVEKAGSLTGLLSSWEARLLAVGSAHGRLDLTLSEISRHYRKSAEWWRRMRSRLALPAAVLLLGWLLLPIPKLISGEWRVSTYIAGNALLVILIGLAWRWMASAAGYPSFLDAFLTRGPAGLLLRMYHRSRFLNALALLIEAGMPAMEAVGEATESCRSPRLREAWRGTIGSLESGLTVAASLKRHRVLDETGYALIDSGEASGKLVEMLKHERDRLEGDLRLKLEVLAEWLPWAVYLLVILLLAHVMF